MFAIFDSFNDATKTLMQSLKTADIDYLPLFVHDNGDLPKGAMSPFSYYASSHSSYCSDKNNTGDLITQGKDSAKGQDFDPFRLGRKELFFNQVPVPDNYEIRQEDMPFGEILHDGFVAGRINYRPDSFRRVKSVDWLDRAGQITHSDCYDSHGRHYASMYYHGTKAYQKVYYSYSDEKREVIVQDLLAGHIFLEFEDKRFFFDSLTNFFLHFLEELDMPKDRLIINSLSFPLFIARRFCEEPSAVLFWQEQMGDKVPGNLEEELLRQKSLKDIVLCDQKQIDQITQDYPETKLKLHYLSAIGQFASHEDFEQNRCFTLTASDQIPGLEQLLSKFPQTTFVVAALTQMSQKLHSLGDIYPNLELLPVVARAEITTQLNKASVYLDINDGGQVLGIVKDAYLSGLLVLGVSNQAKTKDFSLNYDSIYQLEDMLLKALSDDAERAQLLKKLHEKQGPLSSVHDYQVLLKQ